MKITRYRINTIMEEAPCDYCGMPLYVDDYAREANGRVYCSANCAEKHADENPQWQTPDPEPVSLARFEAVQNARLDAQDQRAAAEPILISSAHDSECECYTCQPSAPHNQPAQSSFGALADSSIAIRTTPGGQRAF